MRGPSIQRPVANAPEIDLDAASSSDRRATRSAKADNSRAAAASLSAATPGSGAATASDSEHCGFEDGPKSAPAEMRDGDIVADQTKAAGPSWVTTQARIDAALRGSADPFDHAVADLVNVGNMRTPAGQLETLVQSAAASSDPRIYSLAFRACYSVGHRSPIFKKPGPPAFCASLTARRWAALDPGNGVPWLWVLSQAGDDEDEAGRQDALAHLAATTRFDDRAWQAAAAVVAHAPAEDANDVATHDLATQAWSALSPPGLGPLATLCRAQAGGDTTLADQCASIATTMFDRSDSWGLRFAGASLTVYLTGDETRRIAARAERAALDARLRANIPPSSCGVLHDQMRHTLRAGQIGDLAADREEATLAAKP